MPPERTVVVGAGLAGVALARELTDLGETVLLLEREPAPKGGTTQAPGLVLQLSESHAATKFMMRAATQLDAARAQGRRVFSRVGSLRLAYSHERLLELKRWASLAKAAGLEAKLLAAHEVPFAEKKVLHGALHVPSDGIVDSALLSRFYGVEIRARAKVVGIDLKDGRVVGVRTPEEDIACSRVVVAAGADSAQLAKLAGAFLPQVPLQTQWVKTEPLKEVRALGAKELPVIVDPDARVWLCRAGDALVVGGRDDQPVPADKPASFSPARFDAVWKRAAEHFPALSSAKWEAKSNVLTPFSFDGLPLVGPAEIEGLWFSCGFSDLGPAAASVSAEILARWMVEGKTDLDRSLEARRTGAHVKSPGFVAARAAECRARGDELAYPHREHQSARKLKQTSLARKLSELGAVWGEADGWERPNWFAWNEAAGDDAIVPQGWAAKNWSPAIAAEQIACRRAAALFDLSSSAKEEQCRLGLWGPAAPDIVRAASGDDFSEEGFPAGSSKRVKLGGLTPLLIRTSLVGETGWELWTEMKSGPKLFDALWEAGRPFGLLAAGFRALDALVIENGLPGLVRLELEDPAQICLGGEAVCERGRMVGRVIRAAYAAASNKSIAYAELNDFQSKPGTKLEIDLFGERAPAVVVA